MPTSVNLPIQITRAKKRFRLPAHLSSPGSAVLGITPEPPCQNAPLPGLTLTRRHRRSMAEIKRSILTQLSRRIHAEGLDRTGKPVKESGVLQRI